MGRFQFLVGLNFLEAVFQQDCASADSKNCKAFGFFEFVGIFLELFADSDRVRASLRSKAP